MADPFGNLEHIEVASLIILAIMLVGIAIYTIVMTGVMSTTTANEKNAEDAINVLRVAVKSKYNII